MEEYDSTSIIVKQCEKLASSDSDDGAWWFFWTTTANDDNEINVLFSIKVKIIGVGWKIHVEEVLNRLKL